MVKTKKKRAKPNKVKAIISVDAKEWLQFKRLCKKNATTPSAIIRRRVKELLDGDLDVKLIADKARWDAYWADNRRAFKC